MILITGATGLVGRELVGMLQTVGADVRALSRHPEKAGLPGGVEVIAGDLGEPTSLRAALDGAERVYLFSAGRVGENFAATAQQAGVKRIVVVSGLDNDPARVEDPLRAAGLDWTHLRPTAFAANALRHWGYTIRAQDMVRTPYGDAATAPIHETDIAAVAATVLLNDGQGGQRYELTGPTSLTFRDQVAVISGATGREITFVEETPDQARERMLRFIPEAIVDGLLAVWAAAVGTRATISPAVEQVTGHSPRTFAQWVTDHAGEFAQ